MAISLGKNHLRAWHMPPITVPPTAFYFIPMRLVSFPYRFTIARALHPGRNSWRRGNLLPSLSLKTTGGGAIQDGLLRLGRSLLCGPVGPAHGLDRAVAAPQPSRSRTRNYAPPRWGSSNTYQDSDKTGGSRAWQVATPESLSSRQGREGPLNAATPAIHPARSKRPGGPPTLLDAATPAHPVHGK
jgi:hypothetical protein